MTVADGAPPDTLAPPAGLIGWLKRHVPTREAIERNRLLRPVAHRILVPALWRFNRRSVPRGVALGIVSALLFPFAHTAIAALLALPVRANVPVAVSTTFLNNPLTIAPILFAAYKIGSWVLRLDGVVPGRPLATNVHQHLGIMHWIATGGPPTVVGLVVIAVVAAALGYLVTGWLWRVRIARKWRTRHRRKPYLTPADDGVEQVRLDSR